MIKLRSKNLFDYKTMAVKSETVGLGLIDNGWLVKEDNAGYGCRLTEQLAWLKPNVDYFLVADYKCLVVPTTENKGWVRLIIGGTTGSWEINGSCKSLSVGERGRFIIKCNYDGTANGNIIVFYNGGADRLWSFKITNLCLFEANYTIDYVPYWYEPTKIMTKHNGSMSEVKTIAYGVKDECKIVFDGSENWEQYSSGNWRGMHCIKANNAHNLRDAQYNNYWGLQYYDNPDKFLWLQNANNAYIAWNSGSPPYPSWETTDANGKAIANIPQIKADLEKKNLIVYYDNTNSRPKTLAELLKIVRREVYNNNTEEEVS